nr:hypothetical protein GZ26E7_28 [uncultured archaeon GZfos26E7]
MIRTFRRTSEKRKSTIFGVSEVRICASISMNDTASQTVSKKDNREACLLHFPSRLPSPDPHVSRKHEQPDRKEHDSRQFRDRGAWDCPIESWIGCHVAPARIVRPV